MKIRVLIAIIVAAGFLFLFYTIQKELNNQEPKKKIFNHAITYSNKSYEPYDTKFVFDSFKKYAKNEPIINLKKFDYENYKLDSANSVLVIISPNFLPSNSESQRMLDYVAAGNIAYISTFAMSPTLIDSLVIPSSPASFYENFPPKIYHNDSLSINWFASSIDTLGVNKDETYTYPGKNTVNYFEKYFEDSEAVNVLANDADGNASLIEILYGDGKIYIQLRPMTMTNYFLLHKNNYTYLNKIFEQIELKDRTLIIDEFYKNRRNLVNDYESNNQENESFLWRFIKEHPPLKWAVFTFFLAVIMFVLTNAKRMQAPVKILPDIANNSIQFSEAIAGLYWINQDHKKIAEKITLQLNDYFQVNFKIYPKDLVKENLKKIMQKTNKNEEDLNQVFAYFEAITKNEEISKKTLIGYYKAAYLLMK